MRPRYITATRSHRCSTTLRSWATNTSVKSRRRCRSRSRLRICDWIETSRAETGSSATRNRGLDRQGPGDADALALAAAELMRVAPGVVRLEPDQAEHLLDPLVAARCRLTPWTRSPSAMRVADGGPGVERRVRVLEHDLHLAAAAAAADRPWRPAGPRRRSVIEPASGSIRRRSRRPSVRLAAARLAHQARAPRRCRRRGRRRRRPRTCPPTVPKAPPWIGKVLTSPADLEQRVRDAPVDRRCRASGPSSVELDGRHVDLRPASLCRKQRTWWPGATSTSAGISSVQLR